MADVTSVAVGATTVGANFNQITAGSGLGGNIYIVAIATGTITHKAAETLYTTGDANDNVYTVVAVEGTADGDHMALQGTVEPDAPSGVTLVASFVAGKTY